MMGSANGPGAVPGNENSSSSLSQSDSFQERLLREIPGVVWTTNCQLEFTSCYGAGLAALQLDNHSLIGRTLYEFFQTNDRSFPAIAAHLQALAGATVEFEQPWQGLRFQTVVKPLEDEQHQIVGCLGIAQDATAHRDAEEKTENSLHLHVALSRILHVALEPISLLKQLEKMLDVLLELPWWHGESQAAIFLVDEAHAQLRLAAARGPHQEMISPCDRVPMGACWCGLAASQRTLVLAQSGAPCEWPHHPCTPAHGHYCVPIQSDSELIGVLNLYLKVSYRAESDESVFLASVGNAIAGVIQHKQTEEALRQSEERFALAILGTDAGIWDWNLLTNRVFYSSRWKDMLGYDDAEIGDDLSEWERRLHPEDRERALSTVAAYREGRLIDYELEHRLQHKDGSYRWIMARGIIVRDAAGIPYRMAGSHIDVTHRKQAELALREREVQLRVAGEIQRHLLPQSAPVIPGFQVAGACYPAAIAAGDHFEYQWLPDGSFLIVLGDVSGHGFGPAMVTAVLHARCLTLCESETDLSLLVTKLNAGLYRETDGELFVTAIVARLDPSTQTISWINAGHPPGIVLDARGHLKARLESSSLPLAIRPNTQYVVAPPIQLVRDDLVLLFTDGLVEAYHPENGFLGMGRVLEVARNHRHLTAAEIVKRLDQAVEAHAAGHHRLDDVTIVVAKVGDPVES